jgi:hypothetical protein
MAASTVQLPNECACGTATWGQEGFLVEGADEERSEYGLASGICLGSYEMLGRISKRPHITAGEAGNGCITLYIETMYIYCGVLDG